MKNKKIILSVGLLLTLVSSVFGATIWMYQSQTMTHSITVSGLRAISLATTHTAYTTKILASSIAGIPATAGIPAFALAITDQNILDATGLKLQIGITNGVALTNYNVQVYMAWTLKGTETTQNRIGYYNDAGVRKAMWIETTNMWFVGEELGLNSQVTDFKNITACVDKNGDGIEMVTIAQTDIPKMMYDTTLPTVMTNFLDCNGVTLFFVFSANSNDPSIPLGTHDFEITCTLGKTA